MIVDNWHQQHSSRKTNPQIPHTPPAFLLPVLRVGVKLALWGDEPIQLLALSKRLLKLDGKLIIKLELQLSF